MEPRDYLLSRSDALIVGMVAMAQVELAAGCRMVADPRAAGVGRFLLLHQFVGGRHDGSDDAELGEVGPDV
jgi:hypothetical protein